MPRPVTVLAVLAILTAPASAFAALGPSQHSEVLDASLLAEDPAATVRALVHFASPPTKADEGVVRDLGFAPLVRYDIVPVLLVEGPAGLLPQLARSARVEAIEPDRVLPYLLDTATTTLGARALWTSTHMRWPETDPAYTVAQGIDGLGVGIAIVDSGVDATHPDLLLKAIADVTGAPWTTLANYKIVGRDSVNLVADSAASDAVQANTLAIPLAHTDNTGGHGTHVAGAAAGKGIASAGKYKGSAPGAHLVGYGAGEALVVSLALAAFDHIHAHHEELGIRIVSNSWGGPGDWQPQFAVTKAARALVADGLVVVFAAGNNGGNGATIQSSTWSNIPEVISVANWDESTSYAHSSSSRGRLDLERTWPDVAAVGTNLISAAALGGPVTQYGNAQDVVFLGGETVIPIAGMPITLEAGGVIVGPYASFTGTSMATPMVSGVIAQMLQANPDLTPAQVKAILRMTARLPAGATYEDDGFALGRGLVQAPLAIAVALRIADGLSFENAVRTARLDVVDGDLVVNPTSPGSVLFTPTLVAPSVAGLGQTIELRLSAIGGDMYSTPTFAWDFDGDLVYDDASGDVVSWTAPTLGPALLRYQATSGAETLTSEWTIDVQSVPRVLFDDDMERDASGWIVENGGATGATSGWDHRNSVADPLGNKYYIGGFFGAASGTGFWHAGVRHTPGTGGHAYIPGADSTLAIAAPLDVEGATSVTLQYSIQGQSMAPVVIEASADGGAWTEVARVGGNIVWGGGVLFAETRTLDLTAAAAGASELEVRFHFTTRLPSANIIDPLFWTVFESQTFGGWALDDVKVDATY